METIERYVNKTYNVDMRVLFNISNIQMPSVDHPGKPDENAVDYDEVEMDIYKEELKQWVKDRKALERSMRALYAVIWGQCSLAMITKLMSLQDIDTWRDEGSCYSLLQAIQQIMMRYEHQRCPYVTLFKQMKYFFSYRQAERQSLSKYRQVFQTMVESIERYGGTFGD